MQINIEKKHLYIFLGLLIIFATVSYVQSTGYEDQQSHEVLYTDIITGKSGSEVIMDDELYVNGNINIRDNNGNPSMRYPNRPIFWL